MKLMIRAHDLGVKGEEKIISRLSELDLDGIQLVVYKSIDGVSYMEGALDSARAKAIGDKIRAAGKEVALVGAYFNPVHPDRNKAQRGVRIFAEYLSLAADLGAFVVGSETGSYMGDPWGFHPDNSKPEALETVSDTFRYLADVAKEFGACVGIEGAYNHVCSTPDVLDGVIRKIGRSNIKVIFDLYNYLSDSNYEDAYAILKRAHELFGSDILLYHVKDFTVTDGKIFQCGVGKGVLDYKKILTEIYALNPDAVLVFEGTVGDDIPYAVRYIRNIINEIQESKT